MKIRVVSDYDISVAIIEIGKVAEGIGFTAAATMKISTAVSELARNLIKYAGGGMVSARVIEDGRRKGIQILVSDRGPGIENVEEALSDRFSTGGTLGLGLPGVERMMDEFDLTTEVGKGTKVKIRHWLS